MLCASGWAFSISSKTIIEYGRRRRASYEQTAWSEQRNELLTAIRRLPAERQQLLICKFVEHLPNSEIGLIMGRSEGAIKSLYHRTLLALRQELEQPSS